MLVQSLRKVDPLVCNSVRQIEFRGTVILLEKFEANANLAPHQSAQVIIQCGTRYVDFFPLLGD